MTETLSTLANRLGKQLIKQGMQLVTAESCTGGGLSYWLTSVSGSSAWFERGYVTYSNHAKIEMLGISPAKLKRYGAVSREIAEAMAIGALKHSHANMSVAITGIAGPAGGSLSKPVGTIWVALATHPKQLTSHRLALKGNRTHIRNTTIRYALERISAALQHTKLSQKT